jgi:hypothetical protein
MAYSSPVVWHPHRTALFVAGVVVGVLTSPFAAVWTFVVGLVVMLAAVFIGRGRLDGAAGAFFAVAGGLVAGALPYLLLGLLQYGGSAAG